MTKKVFLLAVFIPSLSYAYVPPKGIPNPSLYFGSFGEVDQATPDKYTKCPEWRTTGNAEPNHKCYYVDKTFTGAASCTAVGMPAACCTGAGTGPSCLAATNSSNPQGSPNTPRLTLPEGVLPQGAYVYVHAGTYVATDSDGQNLDFSGVGLDTDPIWITGNPDPFPIIQDPVAIGWMASTSYVVFENFAFSRGAYTGNISVGPAANDLTIDHVVVRNCVLQGAGKSNNKPADGDTSDGGGIQVGRGGRPVNSNTSHVVVYKVDVSDFGFSTGPGGGEEMGVSVSQAVDHFWVLDSHIHNVGADGVAGCHTCRLGEDTRVEHYFIGRNRLHSNGENCIDVKNTRHLFISENDCTGPFQDEQGGGMVVHYGGSGNVGARDVWILFNRIYHVTAGFACSSCGEGVHVIGNQIYDINHAYTGLGDSGEPACSSASAPECGSAVVAWGVDGPIDVVDNTIFNAEKGVTIAETLSATTPLTVFGNIIAGRTDATKHEVSVGGGTDHASFGNNLFDHADGAAFYLGGRQDLAYLHETLHQCGHPGASTCISGNPMFVQPSSHDLRLQAGSPAISANTRNALYDLYETTYGVSIERDFASYTRPQGGAWDIGAYEYVPLDGGVADSGDLDDDDSEKGLGCGCVSGQRGDDLADGWVLLGVASDLLACCRRRSWGRRHL